MMTCYLRDVNKFLRYRTPCKSILKCGFSTKGIELARFVLFKILGVPYEQYFPVRMKIFRQSGKLVSLQQACTRRSDNIYLVQSWFVTHKACTRRSDNIYLVQSWFVTHTKKLEEVCFVDKKFLHKNANKNGVYMRIMVCYRDIPEGMVIKAD